MPIQKYNAVDNTRVTLPAYREPVVRPYKEGFYTSPDAKSELRQLDRPPPLEFQVRTALDNYDRAHDFFKEQFDKTGLTDAAAESRDFYENELYLTHPALAAIGSTLSGEVFDFWRDATTDPINVATAGMSTAPKAGLNVGVMKKFKAVHPDDAFKVTKDDLYNWAKERGYPDVSGSSEQALEKRRRIALSLGELAEEVPRKARYDEMLGLPAPEKVLVKGPGHKPTIELARFSPTDDLPHPTYYVPPTRQEVEAAGIGDVAMPGKELPLRDRPEINYDTPLYKGVMHGDTPTPISGDFAKGRAGTVSGAEINEAWFGPGVYAATDIDKAGWYAGADELGLGIPNGSLFAIERQYIPDAESVLQSWRSFADIESPVMREKLLALFGPKMAKEGRYTPIHDYLQGGNIKDQSELFRELKDLGIKEIQHYDGGTVNTAILGDFRAKEMPWISEDPDNIVDSPGWWGDPE